MRSSPGRDLNLQPSDCKSGTLPHSHCTTDCDWLNPPYDRMKRISLLLLTSKYTLRHVYQNQIIIWLQVIRRRDKDDIRIAVMICSPQLYLYSAFWNIYVILLSKINVGRQKFIFLLLCCIPPLCLHSIVAWKHREVCYHLGARVNQTDLHKVPEVWFNARITSVGSGRDQDGMSTVPVVSAARLRDKTSSQKRHPDATDRVRGYFRLFVLPTLFSWTRRR